MGAMALTTPFNRFTSASRNAMLAHHLEQMVPPKHSDIPRTMTGFENQLEAFNITMPVDGTIISVHYKFRRGLDQYAIKENPCITIIFQCQETGTYDTLDITTYHSKHKVYGVKYKISPIVRQLKPGVTIGKGTILAQSPNVKEGGIYTSGLSCNVTNLSLPGTIEDGYVVSKSFCERGSLLELPSVVGSFGKKLYPLNTYGDEYNFKAYPEIGEKIRDDGLVFAFREYNPLFDAIEMTNKSLMQIDMIHDFRIYGAAGATVYDIIVESGIGESNAKRNTPPGMAIQSERYINHLREYYNEIIATYDTLHRRDKNINVSPRLTQLITRAYADQPNNVKTKSSTGGKVRRLYKGIPLDEYRVEIKCARENPLGMGSKLTGLFGDKGVITAIKDDCDMPMDSDGNVADVVKFAKSAVARMNPGQFVDQYSGAAARDMSKWVRSNYDKIPLSDIWNRLLNFYEAAAPTIFDSLSTHYLNDTDKINHINSIIQSGIYLYISPDSECLDDVSEYVRNIDAVIKPTYGPVTYKDSSGKFVTTKDKVFIGIQQIIILEKTDQHPMAASSGILQHHGLLAGTNKITRNGHPSKVQTVKVFSETEVRLYLATMGPIMGKALAMANNPDAHKAVVRALIHTSTPTNMDTVDDYTLGNSRPIIFMSSTLEAFGLGINTGISQIGK